MVLEAQRVTLRDYRAGRHEWADNLPSVYALFSICTCSRCLWELNAPSWLYHSCLTRESTTQSRSIFYRRHWSLTRNPWWKPQSKECNGNLSLFYRIPVNRIRLSSRKTQETSNEDFNPLFLLLAFEVQFHRRSYPSLAPSARRGHLAWQGWRRSQKTERMRLR